MAEEHKNNSKEKITPNLQYAILCDGVTPPDQRGKVSFIGVFDKFLRSGVVPNFTLVIGWKNGKGTHTSKIRFLNPDLQEILQTPEISFTLKDETEPSKAILNLGQMNFSVPGVYWIEILMNDETIQSIPLPVEDGNGL